MDKDREEQNEVKHKFINGAGGTGLCAPIVSKGSYVDDWETVSCPKCLALKEKSIADEKKVQEIKSKLSVLLMEIR